MSFPIRTCVGCRKTAAKQQLVRLVLVSGTVQIDHKKVLPGRGAYVHEDCFAAAEKRKAINRALRVRSA